jgi:hypothetical protein
MTAHSEARAAADEAAAALKAARAVMAMLQHQHLGERAARLRAVERLIRIHAPEYRRPLAQERGDRPRAEVDDREFPLPGEEPPDPPDEE